MKYTIELSDESEMDITAGEVSVQDGALVFAAEGVTVLVVAPRVWRTVRRHGLDRLPLPAKQAPRLPLQPVLNRQDLG
jgi:hypothetical protein